MEGVLWDGARRQPGTAQLGAMRQGDAHGGPCQQELLEEQVPSLLTPLASSAGAGGSGPARVIMAGLREEAVKQKEEEKTVMVAPRP